MNNDLENLKKKYMAGGTSTTQPAPITQSGSLSSLRDKYSSDIYKTTEATTPAPLPKKGIEITKQSSLAQDGFSFGEKVQATGATISDLGFSLLKGIFRVGEGIADLGTYAVAGIADLFGADEWAEKQRGFAKENTTDTQIFDTREMSKMFTDKPMTINTFDLIKEQSFAGESTRQLAEGIGYVGGMVGTGAILGAGSGATAAKTGLSQINVGGLAAKGAGRIGLQLSPKILKVVSNFSIPTASLLSASGNAMSQAYNEGATDGQAFIYGLSSGIVEGMVEGLGGISSIKMKALGSGATDTLKKSLVDKIKSNVGKALMNAGVEFFDEGLEEVISGFINPYLQRLTYNKDAANATADELFNEFVMGGLVAGILGMPSVINSMGKKSTSVETTKTPSPNTQEQQEIVKEDAKKASVDATVKGDLRAVDARINFLEDKISTVTNVKNIDIEGIAAELKLLREEKLEITKQASPEIQKEVLEQLTLDLDMLENTPSEQQTEVTQEKIKIKKEQQAKIINEIDKDKVIKTTYNKQFIVDNKESLLVDAQNIVSEMNAKRTTEKPLEIQPETEYDETQQRISDVAAAFKKQVVFLKNSDFGGMVPLQNESLIFIGDNINNDLILSNNKVDQMTYTVGHELFHSLKMSQPEIFNEFTNFIKTEVTEEQLVKFMENYDPTDEFGLLKGIQTDGKFDLETIKADPKKYASQNKALNYIVEEMVANEFGGMITDKKYMTDLKNKNKGLFTKIVKALKTLFNEIDAPIYNSPLTQLQVTKIRKDFEFLSSYVTENLEVKQEVKQEVNVEPKKQEIVEKVVEKVETKKEKIPTKKEAIKSEIKKEKLPKKVEIVEEIEDFETKEPTKEDLMKKKPEPDFIDKSPIKVTQMSLEERKRAIDRNLTNYRREENSRRKTELKNGLIKTYDAYQKAGGTEVIQQIEDFKKEEFKNKINEKKLLPSKEEYAMYHRPSEGPRAFDLLEVNEDISGPKDIYTNPQYYTGTLNKQELQQTMAALNKVKGDPEAMITIYRATPGNEINNGDWVTLSKSYAEQHNESQLDGRGNVLEKTVKAKDIRWALDDLAEWGYFPEITEKKMLPSKTVKDNKGKTLTKEQQEYFKESKVKDENGNLLQIYHTTTDRKNSPFYEFNPVGTPGYRFDDVVVNFYTDNEVMSESYAGKDTPVNITGYNLKTIEGIKNYLKQTHTGTLSKTKEGYVYEPSVIKIITKKVPAMKSFLESLTVHEKRLLKETVYNSLKNNTDTSLEIYKLMLRTMTESEQKELGILYPEPNGKISDTNRLLGQKIKEMYNNTKNSNMNRGAVFSILRDYDFSTHISFEDETAVENYFQSRDKKQNSGKYKYSGYLNLKNPFVVDGKNKSWNKIKQGVDTQAAEYVQLLSKDEKEILIKAAKDSNSRFAGNYNLELQSFKTNMGLDLYAELRDRTKNYIGDYDLYDLALSEFNDDSLQKEATTNEIVKEVLKNNTKNYDGVIIKNIYDYGHIDGLSTTSPGNVYISFASNQFKGIDNTNPTQSDDIRYLPSNPTKEDRTTGISEFVTNTLEKSPAFDFLREEIKKDPSFGQYEKLSEDVVKSKTEELIKNRLDETIDKIHKGTEVLNPMEQQIAATMINEYDKRGDIDSAMALTKLLQSGTVTPAAQALEAVKRLQKNPYYIVNDFKNMVDKMNEEFMNSDDITIKNWLKEHTKGVELTAADNEYILQMAKKLENLDENSQEYAQRWALIQNYVANKMPKNFWTKVKNFRRMGFLFNPKTMIRNWAGNVMMDPVYKVTDMFGSKIDEYLSKIYGTTRTTGTTDNKLYRKAKKEGTQISKQDYELGITTSLGNPYEIMAGQTFNPDNLVGRTLNEVEKLTNYLMARGDRGFENAHYVSTLTNLMRLNDVDVATQEMIQLAKDTAAKRTWKNNGKMVKTARQIRSLFNQIGIKDGKFGKHEFGSKVDIGLGDIILPFIMTPANLLVATYDFSPAAAVSAVRNWNTLKETIKKGGNVLDAQKTFVDSVSKATTGTLLFIIAGALAKMGIITGGEDEDKDKRELDKILGNQPYSVKIGDMSFTYDWAQPLSNIFATMGEVQRQQDVGKTNFLKTVGDAFTTGGDRLLEQSFLQNIRTLLGGGYNDNSLGERVIDLTADIPASMVPTLFKQFADFLDSDIKSTYDKNNPLQTMIAKTMARIPIVKSALPTKKDVLGNDLKYHSGIGEGVLTSFLSPMNIKRDVAGELGDEITDVFNHTGDKTIIPQVAIKYIDYDSNGDGKAERFNFNPTQQSQLQEAMGKIVSDSFGNIFANDVYMNATYDEKAKALTSLMEYSKGKALEDLGLVPNYVSGNANVKQIKNYIDSGLDVSNAIMYDSMINPIKSDLDADGKAISGTLQGKKAYTIMNMQISDNAKDTMLDLITTSKNPETVNTLGKLSTQQQFIEYYSLNRSDTFVMEKFSRDDYDVATTKFNIDGKEFMKAVNGLSEIKSDIDKNGKTIENSKKNKTIQYINTLPLSSIQKIYMYGMAGYSVKQWRNELYNHINSLPMTSQEKKDLWKQLGLE